MFIIEPRYVKAGKSSHPAIDGVMNKKDGS